MDFWRSCRWMLASEAPWHCNTTIIRRHCKVIVESWCRAGMTLRTDRRICPLSTTMPRRLAFYQSCITTPSPHAAILLWQLITNICPGPLDLQMASAWKCRGSERRFASIMQCQGKGIMGHMRAGGVSKVTKAGRSRRRNASSFWDYDKYFWLSMLPSIRYKEYSDKKKRKNERKEKKNIRKR